LKDGCYQVADDLRARVMWKQADLLQGVEPGPWNIILWRNMAIYLEKSAAGLVWDRLHRELAPGGLLVTGKAETPPAHLAFKKLASCLYEKN
jgi:chemotaxis protein methyltransferase CheR